MLDPGKPPIVIAFDAGFRKLGVFVVEILPKGDRPCLAFTVVNKEKKKPEPVGGLRWRKAPDATGGSSRVAKEDFEQCMLQLDIALDKIPEKYLQQLAGVMVELPSGGAQGARANRCMGMATGLFAGLVKVLMERLGQALTCELFLPTEIEPLLGIERHVEKGAPKANKAAARKEKKERARALVLAEWPQFTGWPKTSTTAEDAYDAAATFLASRKKPNGLYAMLRRHAELMATKLA